MCLKWGYQILFFHNSANTHRYRNGISHITDTNGNVFIDREGIRNVTLNFYSGLWIVPSHGSFNENLHALPSDLSVISLTDSDILTRPIYY